MPLKDSTPVCMIGTNSDTRFHLSLNVSSLQRSVAFFTAMFGAKPAKLRSDYAKFECDDPALVLSLEPNAPHGAGPLNHMGFRVTDSASLVTIQSRLEAAGISTTREDGVECCYAKQTKFWLKDPDNNLWEFYTLHEDIEHRGYVTGITLQKATHELEATVSQSLVQSVWSHRLGEPLSTELFVLPNSVDEASLEGTLNDITTPASRAKLFQAIHAAVKPTGRLRIHALTADRETLPKEISLPGPASVVRQVLFLNQLISELRVHGFHSIEIEKFSAQPCFLCDGAELRETKLVCFKEVPKSQMPICRRVLYKGPASSVTLPSGKTLHAGLIEEVDATEIAVLVNTHEEFIVLNSATPADFLPNII